VDALVLRALEKDPNARYATSREFAIAVEQGMQLLSPREVGEWVENIAGDSLEQRERDLAEIESISAVGHLSAFNDSEPQLMRTLINTWSGQRKAPQSPGQAPPVPLGPAFPNRMPIISDRPAAEDDATVLYPAPPREAPSEDRTQVYVDSDEATSPGKSRDAGEVNPFARHGRRWLPVGLGAALLLLLGVVGASWIGSSPEPGNDGEPEALGTTKSAPARSAPQVNDELRAPEPSPSAESAPPPVDVDELPQAEPIPQKMAPKKATRPVRSSGSEPKPKCAQPWTMGADGVRRIRPECL
jgi:serine/threonine-protein kinase